jgi:eukaryotic-like serine/threonine-protein kinase
MGAKPARKFTDETVADPSSATSATGPGVSGNLDVILEQGSVLGGRYEVLEMLGIGGMGAVYKAQDRELDRTIALKVVRPDLARNPEILQRFKQELLTARQVTHKNVIRIFDLAEADGIKFITMEYVAGHDLRRQLADHGKLPPAEAIEIIQQACAGVAAAHAEGVIHRDLKPGNILRDSQGRVVVMDFGLARTITGDGMTKTGAMLGTVEYMSPEQARAEKLDARSDLFTLGIIFYELLTGKTPYQADSAIASLLKRTQEPAVPAHQEDPDVPRALSDILGKALERDPSRRYQTVQEFIDRLDEYQGKRPVSGIAVAPTFTRKRGMLIAGAVVLLVLVAIGIRFWPTKSRKMPAGPHAAVSVLVADFTNHTGDPVFDGTLEPMFNVALEGASFINAYNRGTARKLAQKLPNPTDKLDEQPARLVALSQGINSVVTGEISRRGDSYNISAIVLDAVTGNVITKTEVTATNKDEVVGTVPKLVAPIRGALGDTTPASAQLENARGAFTAASLEVVHQYGIAMEQQFAGKAEEALKSFAKAAELDPNFARAYSGMASADIRLDRQQEAIKDMKLAMEHVDRMTDRERYRVRGLFYVALSNWQKCVEEYRELIKHFPGDNIGHNNLGYCLAELRDFPKAAEQVRQDLAINPNATAASNLSLFSSYAGNFQDGEAEAREAQKKYPTWESTYVALAFAQIGQGQVSQAAETYSKLEKLNPHGASMAAWGLADLALYQGRFAEAVRLLEQGASADLAANNKDAAAEKFAKLAYTHLAAQRKGPAIAAAEKALSNSQTAKIRFLAAQMFSEAGDVARAQKVAAGLASELQTEAQVDARILEGDLALKRRDAQQAIKVLTDANKVLDTWVGHFELGRAYLEAGAFVEADSELEQCIKRRGEALSLFIDEVPTYGYFPPVYYYQGRAREGLKSSGFTDSYRTYLGIRGPAGEDPLLPDVRKRIGQ